MVHDPRLLMLDEPSTGLDPKARLAVWSLIDGIRAETGMTVFLTTHYLEEAEKAGYVVIMDKGQIIAEGTPNELKNRYSYDSLLSYRKRDETFEKGLLAEGYHFSYDGENGLTASSLKTARPPSASCRDLTDIRRISRSSKGRWTTCF